MYRFTDHFLVPVGVSMYADSAVFCPIDTHPPIYPNPGEAKKLQVKTCLFPGRAAKSS